MATTDGFKYYYDIGSPYSWMIGEKLANDLPEAEWIPVLQPDVDDGPLWDGDEERIYSLAAKFGLMEPRWDEDRMNMTIADTTKMMLAATYAKSIGRTLAFSLAAFRQIYNAAKQVDDENTILLAAAACEMHPRAVLKALETKSTTESLKQAGSDLRELVGDRTELPLLLGPGVQAVEADLIALALDEFAPLKAAE